MSQTSKITVDHEIIRSWVQAHGGMPAVARSGFGGGGQGGLEIDFSSHGNPEALEMISWNEFFQRFEKEQLAVLYQESAVGGPSPSLRIISRCPGAPPTGRSSVESRAPQTGNPSIANP